MECSEHYTVLICDGPPQQRHSQTRSDFQNLVRNEAAERLADVHQTYSITSSAVARSDGETVRPKIEAVWRFMTSSDLVD